MSIEEKIKQTLELKVTECECTKPGYCPRHAMFKDERNFGLCCVNNDYFTLWEVCKGPGQPENCGELKGLTEEDIDKAEMNAAYTSPSQGLGDTVAKILHNTGLAKLYEKIVGTCSGCNKRRKWMNKKFGS